MLAEQKMKDSLEETKQYLLDRLNEMPELGIILGSGLGGFADVVENPVIISYKDIPNFPVSTVEGHAGQLIFGKVHGKSVMVMKGRFHYYEGYDMAQVTFPVRVMQILGVKGLLVTNAAGGISPSFHPGDLVLIKDHINLIGDNPLRGRNLSFLGPRFPDMSEAYNREWREKAKNVADKMGLTVKEGVYVAMSGPTYETPAEINFARIIGGDMVGMSTVPEVIVANHGGMKVLGISCITNMAAGVLHQKLSHAEVMETAERVGKDFVRYVQALVREL